MVGPFHFKWKVQNSNNFAIFIFVLDDFHLWNKDDHSLAMFPEEMLVLVKEMVVLLEKCMCSHLFLGKIIFFTCPPLWRLLVLPKEMVVLLERCMCSHVLLSKIISFFGEVHLPLGEMLMFPREMLVLPRAMFVYPKVFPREMFVLPKEGNAYAP